jgi:O-acetylserine/cysteine efflux transporter
MNPRDIALAILPPALWAITYVIAKPATAHFPPLFLIAIVYALTALVMARPWRWRTPFIILLACGTLGGALQSGLIFAGIARVPASLASLAVQSQVPFAVIAAWLLGQEKLRFSNLAGIAVALAGVAIVVGVPATAGENWGLVLIVIGTASWGASQGLIRAHSRESGGELIGAIALVACPQLLIASFVLESGQRQSLASAGLTEWAMVVVLVLAGYALPYSIWYGMLRRYRVDQVTPFALLMPITGVVAGAVFLGERLTEQSIVGGGIILIGLGLVVGLPARRIAT